VVESSQETTPPIESMSESSKVMEVHSDWHTPFMIYLRTGGLSDKKDKHERLHRQAGHYTLVNDELFRRGTDDHLNVAYINERRVFYSPGHSFRDLR
jgi:hypothetical protein